MTAVLQAQGLVFSYPGRHVFNGWSGRFGPGITWVRGANGSGKSTLLKLLGAALAPLAGSLAAAGVDAAAQPLEYRRRVFWCGPGEIAFDHLRAPEYFGFLQGLYPTLDAAALREAVAGLGLSPFLAPRLAELSTGTQRKVWLAAALAVGTPVLLLDEPMIALDATSSAWLLGALRERAAAGTQALVVASHEPLGDAAEGAVRLDLAAA